MINCWNSIFLNSCAQPKSSTVKSWSRVEFTHLKTFPLIFNLFSPCNEIRNKLYYKSKENMVLLIGIYCELMYFVFFLGIFTKSIGKKLKLILFKLLWWLSSIRGILSPQAIFQMIWITLRYSSTQNQSTVLSLLVECRHAFIKIILTFCFSSDLKLQVQQFECVSVKFRTILF